jgi:hypothetical protein
MSDTAGWEPTHFEDHDDRAEAADPGNQQQTEGPAPTKPRRDRDAESSNAEPSDAVPIQLMMAVPPTLIAALSSLSGTLERIASEVAAQGKAIQDLAEAITGRAAPQAAPNGEDTQEDHVPPDLFDERAKNPSGVSSAENSAFSSPNAR